MTAMLLQSLVAALMVASCTLYAAWTLMPAAWRRATALALLKLPLPAGAAAFLHKHSIVASGCACDGCDKSALKAPPPRVHTITLHPRPRK
jgi:hypothetical protein